MKVNLMRSLRGTQGMIFQAPTWLRHPVPYTGQRRGGGREKNDPTNFGIGDRAKGRQTTTLRRLAQSIASDRELSINLSALLRLLHAPWQV